MKTVKAMHLQAEKSKQLYKQDRRVKKSKAFVFCEALAQDDLAGMALDFQPAEKSICRCLPALPGQGRGGG